MTPAAREAIYAHAIAEFPRECCGVIVNDEYYPCHNIAITPAEHFILSPVDYANAEDHGEVTMWVHSHPNVPARPSDADRTACETTGVPWFIVAVWKEAADIVPRIVGDCLFAPDGFEAPYTGRSYQFGVQDCYTLICDWYRREWGLEMPHIERRDGFWLAADGPEHYLANYAAAGFKPVLDGSLQIGDMILMQIRSQVQANHGGIYVGDGNILHHMYNRLSLCEMYHAGWQRVTKLIVRR